jgi:general L-amino acid transport system substrate-binding protein
MNTASSAMNRIAAALCGAIALTSMTFSGTAQAQTLADVRQKGTLTCGVNRALSGFAEQVSGGSWSGFDVDYCKAIAVAIFNDPTKVTYVPLSATERFEALRQKRIDVLVRNSTWTFEREAALGLLFAGVNYYDGQGFLVMRKPSITSALELNGLAICVQAGTTSQLNLADYFRSNSMTYREVALPGLSEIRAALNDGRCDAFSTDQSALFSERLDLARPQDGTILPDVISKEPLGPVVRADDAAWFTLVRWVGYALVNAEELGISTETVAAARASQKPDVRRFVGAEGGFGAMLNLDPAWAINVVAAVGNYAEMFERNLGTQSKLGIPRGLNQLWSNGGILYAPPLR